MPGKDKKQKANQNGRKSVSNQPVRIEGLDRIQNADNRSVSSVPSRRRYAGNEFENASQLSEQAEQEARQKQKAHASVIDHNGGAVPNALNPLPGGQNNVEQEIDLENFINPMDNSFDMEPGADENPGIANELAPVENEPLIGGNIDNNNQIAPVQPPANVPVAANAPVPVAVNQNQDNGFVPKYKGRHGYTVASQGANLVMRGLGHTVGKAAMLPISTVGKIVTATIKDASKFTALTGQQVRSHKVVPGWNGLEFNPSKNTGKDVLDDFRRVPTVWSYLTAGKADDKNGLGVPLPPKVTAYIEEPKQNSSRSMSGMGEVGHAMIGIEYTRKSKITGRNERYNIKYGFYPGDGYVGAAGTAMMLRGAIVPGELRDDSNHSYSISRTYPATDAQIETIAERSEKYTEQGGYGYYARNCTTFVRDMFKAANLPYTDQIFTMEKVRFNTAANFGLTIANTGNGLFDTHMHRILARHSREDETTYQGEGNKRVTAADFRRYLESKNTSGFGQKGYIPAASAENMRRLKTDNSQLGSYHYGGLLGIEEKALSFLPSKDGKVASEVAPGDLVELSDAVMDAKRKFVTAIEKIITDQQMKAADLNLYYWKHNLLVDNPIMALEDDRQAEYDRLEAAEQNLPEEQRKADTIPVHKLLNWRQIKRTHTDVSLEKENISRFYQEVLKSDYRVNKEVMNLLSMDEIALGVLNNLYRATAKANLEGDLGKIREQAVQDKFTVKVNGQKSVEMTPSMYEAYLQVYKQPEIAIAAYKKYSDLKQEHNEDEENKGSATFKLKWSGQKEKEFKDLSKKHYLALQYEAAHRYMLNKDGYNQKDIDYAFKLRRKERSGLGKNASGTMYDNSNTMATTYIGLFFEKVFGGMRNEALKDPRNGGMPVGNNDMRAMCKWINDYLYRKTIAKKRGMTAIIRGLRNAFNNPKREVMKDSFYIQLGDAYLQKVFPPDSSYGERIEQVGSRLFGVRALMENEDSDFKKTIYEIIDEVLREVGLGANPGGNAVPQAPAGPARIGDNKKKKKKK